MNSFDYILALFAWTYPALRLARWARKRRARRDVESRVNRALEPYREGQPRVETCAGVRFLVRVPAKMEIGGPGAWLEGEGR